jgi:outer membrane protein assembly factor BamD (BamD/ComL family)
MPPKPERTVPGQRAAGNPVVPGLYAMSFIIGAVALIGVLFQLGAVLSRRNQPVLIGEIISIVMVGLGGLAAALLLAGLAAIINYLQNQMHVLSRLVRAQEDAVTALSRIDRGAAFSALPALPPAQPVPETTAPQTGLADSRLLEEIGELLHEINENVLLTAEQRQAKRRQSLERMHRDMGETLSRLLAEGKFPEAQQRLDEYARSFPDEQQAVERFQAQVDQARAQAEEGDYQQAADRVRDFMGMAAWDQAEEVIQELLGRHPKSQRVRELVDGLRQERTKFEQQQRQQLLAQVKQAAARNEHREAYRLASELTGRFPDSHEAHSLRNTMQTLKDNAEIAIRKELEEQLKEMARAHRYIEALALAQDIIAKYPTSPQAKALKDQLPQLMSKAKLQMDQSGGA